MIQLMNVSIIKKDNRQSQTPQLPEYRGKRICPNMMSLLLKLTRETHQIEKYMLEVDSNNPPAVKCYERIGFKEELRADNFIKMKLEYTDNKL